MLSHNPRSLRVLEYYVVQALINLKKSGFADNIPDVPGYQPHEVLAIRAWIDTKELARRNPDNISLS